VVVQNMDLFFFLWADEMNLLGMCSLVWRGTSQTAIYCI